MMSAKSNENYDEMSIGVIGVQAGNKEPLTSPWAGGRLVASVSSYT